MEDLDHGDRGGGAKAGWNWRLDYLFFAVTQQAGASARDRRDIVNACNQGPVEGRGGDREE